MKPPIPTSAIKDAKVTKARGTQDDLELIKLIIEEHPGLKKRILDKIRIVRALGGGTSSKSTETSEKD